MVITDPLFYLLAIPALLITGISKGGFGSGAGNLSVPALSLLVAPQQAAAITLPILCAMDLVGIWAYRRDWDPRQMVILAPGALIGIALGALAFSYMTADAVKLMVGVLAVWFSTNHWIRQWLARPQPEPAPRSWGKGLFWSAGSGFTSTIAHAGGTPLMIYMLPQRLPRQTLVATTVVFFFLVNYVKLIPYALIGQFTATNLMMSLLLLPCAPAGMYTGLWLQQRMSDALFYRLAYVLLFTTGAKLCWDVLAARLGG
ncbi:MAG: sulfite exporter TauE/SafE family protein [Alphaproteobacteria bacterium]|nr:sulfite exporter TauE/SafE family protein [Alphaproteobacteria bacterium]